MLPPAPASPRAIVILKADRIYADALRRVTLAALPGSTVRLVTSVQEAASALAAEPADLFVTGVGSTLDGDVLELLSRCTLAPRMAQRRLVVTGCHDFRILTVLRALEVDGIFDTSADALDQLTTALQTVAKGGHYCSRSTMEQMRGSGCTGHDVIRLLTVFEQIVLCVIGDGCDDVAAARELGVSPATVSTVRRDLHRKLGVQHRGELVRLAAQHGFVRFTPSGVVRPGYTLLAAAYRPRRARTEGAAFIGAGMRGALPAGFTV